jgi:SAM-dependent methyltransferase
MSEATGDHADVAELLSSQRTYYDLRASDYMDETKPSDRKVPGFMEREVIRELIEELAPTGDVLEFACGDGVFTRELIRHAQSVTAIDGSPRMLARNRERVGHPDIRYVEADIFAWLPDRVYDTVFFSFWLSHVPPSAFEAFWALVRACVRPGGRVAFVDEDDRASVNDDSRVVGDVPVATRTLSDGRRFDIVKVFWDPDDLEQRLRALDWDIDIRRVGETFLYGSGGRTRA